MEPSSLWRTEYQIHRRVWKPERWLRTAPVESLLNQTARLSGLHLEVAQRVLETCRANVVTR